MHSVLELSATDGRWMRSVRTRASIIDAWLDLVQSGDLSPTARGVADRAGIGIRSVFQHFSDMGALLYAACADMVAAVHDRATEIPDGLPCDERITGIVAKHSSVFEQVTNPRRACERQAWQSADVQSLIDSWEAFGTDSVRRAFAVEFDVAPIESRDLLMSAVDSAVSWSSWYQLRHNRGLTIDQSRAVLCCALHSLLDASTD